MKSFLKCFLIFLIAVSCRKHDDNSGNIGTRITINNFPDDADTISMNFISVLHVSIIGAQFQKYVMKVFNRNFLLLKDSSYNGIFQIPTDKLFYSTGFYDIRFEFYGGLSSQTFNQIINNGTYINKRLVVINSLGFCHIPEPVLTEKNGTLEGRIDTLLPIKALAVYKFYNSNSGRCGYLRRWCFLDACHNDSGNNAF